MSEPSVFRSQPRGLPTSRRLLARRGLWHPSQRHNRSHGPCTTSHNMHVCGVSVCVCTRMYRVPECRRPSRCTIRTLTLVVETAASVGEAVGRRNRSLGRGLVRLTGRRVLLVVFVVVVVAVVLFVVVVAVVHRLDHGLPAQPTSTRISGGGSANYRTGSSANVSTGLGGPTIKRGTSPCLPPHRLRGVRVMK